MPKRKISTQTAGAWPWAQLRQRFPAQTDEASQRKLAAWARKNGVEWELQPGTVRLGRSRQKVRVVVLEPARKPPIRR
jgi:hypothetical protein